MVTLMFYLLLRRSCSPFPLTPKSRKKTDIDFCLDMRHTQVSCVDLTLYIYQTESSMQRF